MSDRFVFRYFFLCLGYFMLFVFSQELDRIFNLYLFLVPLLLLPFGLLLLTIIWGILRNLVRRHWRRAFCATIAPFAAAAPLLICYQLGITPTWLRFQFSLAHYERELATINTADNALRLRAFAWGETGGVAVANVFYTLVFDESGEILLPAERRSAAWLERANQTQLHSFLQGTSTTDVKSMGRHWYVVTEIYQ
jgi:amino acid transporter